MSHRRAKSYGSRLPTMHMGKSKLRYVFTADDVRLFCGSAVLTPASAPSTAAINLMWRSGKKQTLGGVAREIPNGADGSERGARWETPVREPVRGTRGRRGSRESSVAMSGVAQVQCL